MTITYTIPGATLLDQLNPATLDGLPNNDANDNCVGTSVAEGLHIETSKTYDGDEVKDAVYGANYVGTESAARYVSYCAAQGVSLTPHNDTQVGLVAFIRAEVAAGHPVILTMPSDWNTPEPDPVHPSTSTHVGIAVGVGPGMIRVMNPWHGFYQDATDEWWQPRLCEGRVWAMQKVSVGTMSGVPAVSASDNGSVLTFPNGETCGHGIRAHIEAEAWPAELWPVTGEVGDPVGVHQDFRNGGDANAAGRRLTWHSADNSITESVLASPAVALQNQLSAALAAEASAQANVTAAQGQRDALSVQLATAQAQIESLTAQLAAAQAAPPAPAPAPAPTPQERAALDLVAAVKAAINA